MVIWLQCLDKTCRVYLNLIEKSKKHYKNSWNFLLLKMGSIDYPVTKVSNYHYKLRSSPEERRFHLI